MALRRYAIPLSICLVALFAGVARGQVDLQRFDRQLEEINRQTRMDANTDIPAAQRTLLDAGLYFSFQFMAIDDATHNTHILRQYDVTAYMRVNVDDVHEFFFRSSADYRDFNPHDSFNGLGDDFIGPQLDRASYKFDLRNYLNRYEGKNVNYDLTIEAGRQLVHWGNGLTLSEEIDGAAITGKSYPFSLDVVAGITRDKALDFDNFRPGFDDRTHRVFAGAMVSWQALPKHMLYAYGLVQDDQNPDDALNSTLNSVNVTTRFRYDSHYIGVGARGEIIDHLLYGVEAVYEGGTTLSSSFVGDINGVVTPVTQQTDNIAAGAIDFHLEYLLADTHQTKFTGEMLLASGSNNRVAFTNSAFGGNKPGTTDHAFNAFGLINTGLAFAPDASNLAMFRVGASTTPFPGVNAVKRLQVGVDAFLFNKLSNSAPINELTTHDGYLGFETDVYANWQIVSDVSLSVRYGVFFPGSALTHVPGGNGSDPRHFFFSGLTFGF